ncbi:MAG: permease [Treponema sp. CETP13]|nr:MAG: permease [Treponema sp. CETP13]
MSTIILYSTTMILLVVSFVKNKNKTKKALKKALKSFENILPQFLGVMVLVGVLLSVFNADFISKVIGSESGWTGTIVSSVIGAITLIPGFVAFPTAAMLLESGAGYMQIAAFISSLMMVGVVTMPLEISYFGKRVTFTRNILAFLFSFVVAYIIYLVVV